MRSKLVLVTGGARSGKSRFAETYVKSVSNRVTYIATAIAFDDEMKERIAIHQSDRSENWQTIEAYNHLEDYLGQIQMQSDVILLDCVTVMTANLMFEQRLDHYEDMTREERGTLEKQVMEAFVNFIEAFRQTSLTLVCVTNELGMGIVPDNPLSRLYRDIAGRVNQYIAKESDEVHFVVSGIPMQIK